MTPGAEAELMQLIERGAHAEFPARAVVARLAADQTQQGRGLGRALFRDAGRHVFQAAGIIGARGVLAEAIFDEAKPFYLALGMIVSPVDPMVLMVTIHDLRASAAV